MTEAVYVELSPLSRHRALIDHLYVLIDCGRLTAFGRSLFASPFCEIAIGYCCDRSRPLALNTPPRFEHRLRSRPFHGWLAGLRFSPQLAVAEAAQRALIAIACSFAPGDRGETSPDDVVHALDGWMDTWFDSWLGPCTNAYRDIAACGLRLPPSRPAPRMHVGRLAAAQRVSPRTLQRRVRALTGLPPKRYAALQRFDAALRLLASQDQSLAEIAAELGYADQAHMTAEMTKHAGVSPARFRRAARRMVADPNVRFFKDASLEDRLTLLLSDAVAPAPLLLPTG